MKRRYIETTVLVGIVPPRNGNDSEPYGYGTSRALPGE